MSEDEDDAHVTQLIQDLVKIRKFRYNQAEIARRLGTTQSRVSDIEMMRTEIKLSTLMKYTRAVGYKIRLTVEDL